MRPYFLQEGLLALGIHLVIRNNAIEKKKKVQNAPQAMRQSLLLTLDLHNGYSQRSCEKNEKFAIGFPKYSLHNHFDHHYPI